MFIYAYHINILANFETPSLERPSLVYILIHSSSRADNHSPSRIIKSSYFKSFNLYMYTAVSY